VSDSEASLGIFFIMLLLASLFAGGGVMLNHNAARTTSLEYPAGYDTCSEFRAVPEKSVDVTATTSPNGTVTLRYNAPSDIDSLLIQRRETHDLVDTEGFTVGDDYLVLQSNASSPVYVYQVNRSLMRPESTPDGISLDSYREANGTTTLIPGALDASMDVSFPEDGYAGRRIAHIGDISEVRRFQHGCHSISVVYPDGVNQSVAETGTDALEQVALAADFGQPAPNSTLIYHPGPVRGFANGPDGVSGDNDESESTAVHEYIHTRQRMTLASNMEWFTEASATYLTVRLRYSTGSLSLVEYRSSMKSYEDNAQWIDLTTVDRGLESEVGPEYRTGAVVLSRLDGDLRTHGDHTMVDVFRRANQHDGRYNLSDFHSDYAALGGNRSEAEVRAMVADPTVRPSPWTPDTPDPRGTGVIFVLAFTLMLLMAVGTVRNHLG
jgi:hypothetical protein